MGEDNKTYTFTATLGDTLPSIDVLESDVDTVTDRLAEMNTKADEAAATLKALCEVMNVDPIAMKQRMVMNALKNDGKGYPGDLYTDTLEVIGTLIHARDRYKDELEVAKNANFTIKKNCAEAMKERDELKHRISRAAYRLSPPNHATFGKLEKKRRYTKDEVINAQIDIFQQMRDHEDKIIKILTEGFEE